MLFYSYITRQRQNNSNTNGQLADSLNVCNVNNSHNIKHTVHNKKSDTLNNPNVIKKNRLICLYIIARSIMNKNDSTGTKYSGI